MNSNTINLIMAGTLSLEAAHQFSVKLLGEDLQNAFLYYTSSQIPSYERQEVMNSVLFIQGSGLEIAIEMFGLPLEPNVLRETFYDFCNYYRRKWKSP